LVDKFVAVAAFPDQAPEVSITNGEPTVPTPDSGAVTPVRPVKEPPQLELMSDGWQTWTGVPEGYR
jgi:hypothetical protein